MGHHSMGFVVTRCVGEGIYEPPRLHHPKHFIFLSLTTHLHETTPRCQGVVRLLLYLHTLSRQTHLGRRTIAPRLEFYRYTFLVSPVPFLSLLSRSPVNLTLGI